MKRSRERECERECECDEGASTMKRSRPASSPSMSSGAASSSSSSASSSSTSPIILFVAGAMGKMTGEDFATGTVTKPRTAQRAQLSRHGLVVGPVRSLSGSKLSGGAGAGMSRLVAIHQALADVKKAHPHRKIFLATQSAGGRMVAHMFAGLWQTKPKSDGTCARFPLGVVPEKGEASAGIIKEAKTLAEEYPAFCSPEGRAPTGVTGILIFGYPLHHETQDRSLIFPRIQPSTPPMLFLSGDKDEKGEGMERAVAQCRAASTKLVRVPGAGHECWQPYDEQRHALMHAAIASFIEECSAAEQTL